jgi:hypothetical protein
MFFFFFAHCAVCPHRANSLGHVSAVNPKLKALDALYLWGKKKPFPPGQPPASKYTCCFKVEPPAVESRQNVLPPPTPSVFCGDGWPKDKRAINVQKA